MASIAKIVLVAALTLIVASLIIGVGASQFWRRYQIASAGKGDVWVVDTTNGSVAICMVAGKDANPFDDVGAGAIERELNRIQPRCSAWSNGAAFIAKGRL
jgi:hypothetical protein